MTLLIRIPIILTIEVVQGNTGPERLNTPGQRRKMAARQMMFRRAAWTLNNYTEDEIKENVGQFRYIVWGY